MPTGSGPSPSSARIDTSREGIEPRDRDNGRRKRPVIIDAGGRDLIVLLEQTQHPGPRDSAPFHRSLPFITRAFSDRRLAMGWHAKRHPPVGPGSPAARGISASRGIRAARAKPTTGESSGFGARPSPDPPFSQPVRCCSSCFGTALRTPVRLRRRCTYALREASPPCDRTTSK